MNRGPLPGYYYDEDKKKYFKVQANHVAPADAKYSKSNVERERREAKKRKIENRGLAKRLKQTVRHAPILEHPIAGGVGLRRELGLREHVNDAGDRDAFFISQLQPSKQHVEPPNSVRRFGSLFDTFTVDDDLVLAYNHAGASSVYVQQSSHPERWPFPLVAFNSPLVNVHTIFCGGVADGIVACTQEPKTPGNVFIGSYPGRFFGNQDVFLRFGGPDSSLWASALSREQHNLALSGSEAVFVLDVATATSTHRISLQDDSRDVTWLDNRVIAYGEGRKVALFDTRSRGRTIRFTRKIPATAVKSPDQSGVQLLVADNMNIDLYDTRMEKIPLLGWNHLHQGPQLQATASNGLVAALNNYNEVQMYNIRSGKALGAVQQPLSKGNSLMTKLRWTESSSGAPALQACLDGSLVKWIFGGWSAPG